MRLFITVASILVFIAPVTAADSDWVQLFNGKDLTGWKIHDKPSGGILEVIKIEKDGKVIGYDGKLKGDKTTHLWRVEDGKLIGSGPPSHLFSERGDYVNFHYRIEAMINDKGNSGQYFRTEFGPGFPKGYEAQINATHTDRIRTGSLYLPQVKEVLVLNDAPHKAGEFFTQEVICNDDVITIIVNGKKTVDNFKDPMARYKKGHFALQGHDPGTVVTFKKIEVKELK
jgi:3-keto-disaccharide hydrolase